MQAMPLFPVGKKKGIQLEMLSFERTGNGLQAGLLPTAARFVVLEDFVAPDNAGVIEMQVAPPGSGPEHEGRVAVASPRDGDGAGRRLVLDQAVLRKNRGGVSLGGGACLDTKDAIRIVQKRCIRSRNELRIVDRGIR